jgi:hypothetical protein
MVAANPMSLVRPSLKNIARKFLEIFFICMKSVYHKFNNNQCATYVDYRDDLIAELEYHSTEVSHQAQRSR